MSGTGCVYNRVRATRQLLKRYRTPPFSPSLRLHIWVGGFRFDGGSGTFTLQSPLKTIITYIVAGRIPPDLLDVIHSCGVRFYEGALIVEVHDHRPVLARKAEPIDVPKYGFQDPYAAESTSASATAGSSGASADPGSSSAGRTSMPTTGATVEIYRLVLWPNDETLWVDLRLMDTREGKEWSDEDALLVEAKILNLTSPLLCLEPDFQATRIANFMMNATANPASELNLAPSGTFGGPIDIDPNTGMARLPAAGSKRNSSQADKDEEDRIRRSKIMKLMSQGDDDQQDRAMAMLSGTSNATFAPSFSRMNFISDWRAKRMADEMAKNGRAPPNGASANGGGNNENGEGSSGAASRPAAKKKRKRSQKKKDEDDAESDKDVPLAASLSAAPEKAKKLTKKERTKLKEEQERAEQEEKERLEKEAAAAAAAKASTSKSKKKISKKQREKQDAEAAAQAAAAPGAGSVESTPVKTEASGSGKKASSSSATKKSKKPQTPSTPAAASGSQPIQTPVVPSSSVVASPSIGNLPGTPHSGNSAQMSAPGQSNMAPGQPHMLTPQQQHAHAQAQRMMSSIMAQQQQTGSPHQLGAMVGMGQQGGVPGAMAPQQSQAGHQPQPPGQGQSPTLQQQQINRLVQQQMQNIAGPNVNLNQLPPQHRQMLVVQAMRQLGALLPQQNNSSGNQATPQQQAIQAQQQQQQQQQQPQQSQQQQPPQAQIPHQLQMALQGYAQNSMGNPMGSGNVAFPMQQQQQMNPTASQAAALAAIFQQQQQQQQQQNSMLPQQQLQQAAMMPAFQAMMAQNHGQNSANGMMQSSSPQAQHQQTGQQNQSNFNANTGGFNTSFLGNGGQWGSSG
ncbi:hypothetical protein IE81DRAFT_168341 [Ceraceosorus guamensis]|uniref:Spt20-like SEP domain-containing protein n=1 Tax=Ceraceosorus guamensis TaxID=1522189 RepID=A0A316VVC1_9BASI|nr:hypothetical protein IE81DRAFT_168341 [Ceraceosorus guamensis]PWN41587.1 hypothetical protein IE81DRAFT_168341 [Ceraceosorus guamensis]